jgi:AcrR family transcriptional regulator
LVIGESIGRRESKVTSSGAAGALLSPEERRERNRSEVRQAILSAARDVMREQGVAALSLREVARRVRMQAPSLYAYFPSKMALYDALFVLAITHFAQYRDSVDPGGDFWTRLTTRMNAYMTFARENPELHQLAFERPVPGFTPSDESMAVSYRVLGGVEQLLQDGIDQGTLALDIPIPQARDIIVGLFHGITAQHIANDPDAPPGSGRFGGLIPVAMSILRAAWGASPTSGDTSSADAPEEERL